VTAPLTRDAVTARAAGYSDGGTETVVVTIASEEDLRHARHAVRAAAQQAGLRLVDQTMVVTAASELARNCYIHAGGGTVTIEEARRAEPPATGVRLTFADTGPGIEDPDAALADGYTTSGGLGRGLGGARRLVDEFDLRTSTRPPTGTQITVIRWVR
jgi:serine/threonine-protein kinase RsbT